MNRTDTYYRALLEYRKLVDAQRDCKLENKSVATNGVKHDRIYFERKSCIIDRSWVDAIETGLVFIEKAIKEERQFIRSNGEVVPIEKVKNVSKSSVEHLARHSNLITRVHEGEDIIPDQLYTVEKLNDYAVYENRFLYMLLCYLRDFISTRYNKILDISNTYNGTMTMNKSVVADRQTIKYKVELEHTRRDDEYLISTNKEKDVIDRIDLLLKTVLAFLATPLMEIVAKAPMLKPPVTKTNVLKMNNNFKGAMELYGFVTSYEGDGFTVTVEKTELSPFDEELAAEMANTVTLSAFITYENALGLRKELQRNYLLEEQRLREEEYKSGEKRLEELRRQLKNNGITPEEYIVSLEDRVRLLEKRANELPRVQARLDTAQERLSAARAQLDEALAKEKELRGALDSTQYKLDIQIKRYDDDMTRVRAEHTAFVNELHLRHAAELDRVRSECDARIAEINAQHEEEISALKQSHEEKLTALRGELEDRIAAVNAELNAAKESLDTERHEHTAELSRLSDDYEKELEMLRGILGMEKEKAEALEAKARISDAKLYALRFEMGDDFGEDKFVLEENFDNLERTYRAFRKFYQAEWAKAKKHIRKDVLKGASQETDEERSDTSEEITESESIADTEAVDETATPTEVEPIAEQITETDVTDAKTDNTDAVEEYREEAPTDEIPAENIEEDTVNETLTPRELADEETVAESETPTNDVLTVDAAETETTMETETTEETETTTEAEAAAETEIPAEEQSKEETGLTPEQIEEIKANALKMVSSSEIYVGENSSNGSFALDSITQASFVGANDTEGEDDGKKRKKRKGKG